MSTVDYNAASKSVIRAMRTLTENNEHTRAYILGAEMLGEEELAKGLKAVQTRQDQEGGISSDDYLVRWELYLDLKIKAENKLSASSYKKFYEAL